MSFSILGKKTTKIGLHIFRNTISRISSLSDAQLSEALQRLPSANSPFQWQQVSLEKSNSSYFHKRECQRIQNINLTRLFIIHFSLFIILKYRMSFTGTIWQGNRKDL
jgi:hypothetical protein